jgi:hypothetical protein
MLPASRTIGVIWLSLCINIKGNISCAARLLGATKTQSWRWEGFFENIPGEVGGLFWNMIQVSECILEFRSRFLFNVLGIAGGRWQGTYLVYKMPIVIKQIIYNKQTGQLSFMYKI